MHAEGVLVGVHCSDYLKQQVGGSASCQHSIQIFSTTWKGFCAGPLVGWGYSSQAGVAASQNRAGSPDVP
jgi:hypothetical protein